MISGLDKYFERQEKAKVMKLERTPDKMIKSKSARKLKFEDAKLREENKENTYIDNHTSRQPKTNQNIESTIISLHRQLHSLKI